MREIRDRPGFRKEATWLITTGDEHVATVQGVSDRAGTGGIQNFGIIPSHRGRGLSVPLLLQALQGFRTAGLMRASLEVTAQNAAAIALYRRFGFRFRKTIYKMVDHSTVSFAPSAGAADWCV
jgi:ribosomal protein S18 acetylase RimI-like enzyme